MPCQNKIAKSWSKSIDLIFYSFDHVEGGPIRYMTISPGCVFTSRAPGGKNTAWAYCHVPNGSTFNMIERIENQIDRFAPGFRDLVLARHTMNCGELELSNANLVGGDISGGASNLGQLLARPVL